MADDIIVDVCTDRRDTVVDANTERPGHPRVCAGGQTGAYSTFEIVETVTGAPGSAAKAENLGTKTAVKLKLTIPQGMTGGQGARGERGEKGERGEAFTYSDFSEEQLEALRGPQGLRGDQGERGEKGDKGDKGEQGIQGPIGTTGATGPKGDKGDKGDTGAQGPQGIQGPVGPQGPKGADGTMTFEDLTEEQRESLRGKSAYESAQEGGYTGTEEEFYADLASGGGNVQPDWNQNDPTQPDYVKNRTHYEETVLEEILPETATTTVSVGEGRANSSFEYSGESPVFTQKYIITFNGVEYECNLKELYGNFFFGNPGIIGEGEDTGEPFALFVFYYDAICGLFTTTPGEYTISIASRVEMTRHMSPKYIKDMYYDNGVVIENILPEMSFIINEEGTLDDPAEHISEIIIGDTYKVTFDGVEYEFTAFVDDWGDTTIGNISIFDEEYDGSGAPFYVWWRHVLDWGICAAVAGTHTISIDHVYHDLKQIDDKYLGILEDEAITVFEASNVYKDYTCDVPGLFPISGKALIYVKGVKYETEFKGDIYESEAWITLQTEEQPEVRFVTGPDYLFISGETCPDYLYDVRVDVITKKVKHSYVASDWEEDDSESSSFIKNRPGGYGGYVGAIVYRATAANTLQRTSEWNEIVPSAVLQRMPAENTGQYMLARVRETGAERLLCNAGMGTGGYISIVDEKGNHVTSSRFSPGDVISFTTTGTYEVGKDYTVDFYVLSEIIRIPKFYLDETLADKDFVNAALADAGKVQSVNGMVGDVVIESDVFYATYGTTTTAEIEAALTAGKAVYCKNGAYVARFLRKNSAATRHVFGYRDNEYLCDSDTWSTSVVKFSPATHAETHAANGSDPITPDAIGAVSKSGDTMMGSLHIANDNGLYLEFDDSGSGVFMHGSYNDGEPWVELLGSEGDEPVQLAGIADPTDTHDAANKKYVDEAVANAGGAKIATGSYTGTGKNGKSNLNSLTFGFTPKFVVIFNSMSGAATSSGGGSYDEWIMVAIGNKGKLVGMLNTEPYDPNITISENTFTWSHSASASYQMNTSGRVYYYIAFG